MTVCLFVFMPAELWHVPRIKWSAVKSWERWIATWASCCLWSEKSAIHFLDMIRASPQTRNRSLACAFFGGRPAAWCTSRAGMLCKKVCLVCVVSEVSRCPRHSMFTSQSLSFRRIDKTGPETWRCWTGGIQSSVHTLACVRNDM